MDTYRFSELCTVHLRNQAAPLRCILQRARQRPYRRLAVPFLSTDVALRFPRHACHGAGGLSHSPPTPPDGSALVAEVAQPNPLHPGRRSELRQTSFWGTPILSNRDPICAANEHIPAISARRDPAISRATRQKGSYVSRFLIFWAPDHRRLSRPPRSVSCKHRQTPQSSPKLQTFASSLGAQIRPPDTNDIQSIPNLTRPRERSSFGHLPRTSSVDLPRRSCNRTSRCLRYMGSSSG